MIYCKSKDFIFIKVPKTASTSVTHHLLDCLPKDEITLSSRDLFIENIDQNHKSNSTIRHHITADELVSSGILTREEIINTRVFAFVRNPIDWFLSMAHYYHVGQTNKIDFTKRSSIESSFTNEQVVERYLYDPDFHTKMKNQSHWLRFENSLLNNIIPYPNFNLFFEKIGIEKNISHNHRSQHRTNDTRKCDDHLTHKIISVYSGDWEIWKEITCNTPETTPS